MKITNIEWETDGQAVDLPKEVEPPSGLTEERITDWLSDEYGWLVKSWDFIS